MIVGLREKGRIVGGCNGEGMIKLYSRKAWGIGFIRRGRAYAERNLVLLHKGDANESRNIRTQCNCEIRNTRRKKVRPRGGFKTQKQDRYPGRQG